MTLIEALNIFELDENFTDENLAAVYKKLAAKYHPDKFVGGSSEEIKEAEDRFKKINDAFNILKSNSITAMKKRALANLNFYAVDDSIFDPELDLFYNKYKKIINEMIERYKEQLNDITSASQATSISLEIKNKIRELYNEFRNEILEYWHLVLPLQHVDFFYECSLKEFGQQVIDLKSNEKVRREKSIRSEAGQYELWAHYEFLKKRIEKIVEEVVLKARNLEVSEQELINELNSKIKTIFDFNANILKYFRKVEDYFNSKYGEKAITRIINGEIEVLPEIKKAVCSYNNSKNNYESGAIFYEVIEKLKEIETSLMSIQENDDKVDSKRQMQDIFNTLLARKNEVLQNGHWRIDDYCTSGANMTFQRFLNFYEGVIKGKIQLDNAELLNGLTFENFLEDNILLDRIVAHNIKESNVKLYINMQDKIVYSVKRVSLDSVVLMGYVLEQAHEIEVSKKFFEENFVSLDDFLREAEFVGERNVGFRYDALFKHGTCILICDEAKPEKYSIISMTDYFSFGALKLDDSFNNRETIRNEMIKIYGSLLGYEDNYART